MNSKSGPETVKGRRVRRSYTEEFRHGTRFRDPDMHGRHSGR